MAFRAFPLPGAH